MPSRAALLVGAAVALCVPARGEVIERILAVVSGRPVLLSEVRVLQKVRGVTAKEALEATIDERLMYDEAARMPQAGLASGEEQAAYESLLKRAGERAAGLPEGDLKDLSRREAVVLKYVKLRFLPQVRVDDDAVRKAYEAEVAGLESAPALEDEAPALRQRLIDKDLDARIEAWVKELRSAADIRYAAGS